MHGGPGHEADRDQTESDAFPEFELYDGSDGSVSDNGVDGAANQYWPLPFH